MQTVSSLSPRSSRQVDTNQIDWYSADPSSGNVTASGTDADGEIPALGADEEWANDLSFMFASDGVIALTGYSSALQRSAFYWPCGVSYRLVV